jgi:hypothetical protein
MKKLRIKGTVALGVLTLVSGILTMGFAGPASAAGNTPPWEPDPSSVGSLAFYNAAGQQIYSGNLTDSPIAAYVEGSSTIRSGDSVATLYGYLPVNGQLPTQWSGEQLGQSTTFPNPSAPAPLNTSSLPVETGNAGDENIATLEIDYPNTDTSTDGYAGMYQLRLYTNAPRKVQSTEYDSADIFVSGTQWYEVYPPGPLTILPTTLAKATVGKAYSATLTAIGGSGTYTWSLATGSKLPKKLKLSTAGVISGKPTTAGKYKFTVKVSDGTNTATLAEKLTVKS